MNYVGRILKAQGQEDKTKIELEIDENIIETLERQRPKELELILDDGRRITASQRKKAYATINDIAHFTGDVPEAIKEHYKYQLMIKSGVDYFSLKDCSVSTAREYITAMIDDCIEYGIPLGDYGANRTDDIDRYLYMCLKTRTCAITGRKGADIHHVLGSRIGMGRNRLRVDHGNLKLVALSREWHTRVHAEGEENIFKKFKIYGIKADRKLLRELKLKYEDIS